MFCLTLLLSIPLKILSRKSLFFLFFSARRVVGHDRVRDGDDRGVRAGDGAAALVGVVVEKLGAADVNGGGARVGVHRQPVVDAMLFLKKLSVMIEGSTFEGLLSEKAMAPPAVPALLFTKAVRRMVAREL